MDFMHFECGVSDRGRPLTREQLLCTETLKDMIPQGAGNEKTESGQLQKAERTDLKEALFYQHHVKKLGKEMGGGFAYRCNPYSAAQLRKNSRNFL